MNTNSPYDQPWGGPRRRPGGPGGGPGGRPGGPRGGRGGSWAQGTPPWVQGLLDMAQGNQHGFGRGQFGGGPYGRRGGPKVRRGDVRAAILDVLSHEPMNGYQIIQQIAERSGGAWKPSPGSVYPTVQQLEDEGLVEGSEGAGRRLLQLTEEGRSYVEANPEELAATWRPFDQPEEDEGPGDLKPVIGQVMGAVWQVVVSGTKQQQAEAAEILADTRRRLYGLLADGGEADETASERPVEPGDGEQS